MDNWINIIPIIVLAAASVAIILFDEWEKILVSYAVAYLSAFTIIVQFWTFSFSLVKLITGLMSLVILGLSIFHYPVVFKTKTRSERIFRIITLLFMFTVLAFLVYRVTIYLSIPLEIVLASLFLIGLGVFQLGITHELFKLFLAILILFFGFELIFSSNETSLLINGLLAIVALLVSLMGGFLIINEREGAEE